MNFIDLIFINFIIVIVILGALINFIEPYLPVFITQTFRYGKHSYKGAPNKIAQLSEIPKSYFKHFYVFALVWSILITYLVTWTYIGGYALPDFIITCLDVICGRNREVKSTFNKLKSFSLHRYILIFTFFSKCCIDFHCRFLIDATMRSTILRDPFRTGLFQHKQNEFIALHRRILSLLWCLTSYNITGTRICSWIFAGID